MRKQFDYGCLVNLHCDQTEVWYKRQSHVSVQDFMTWLIEINQYLATFLPTLPDQMLLGDNVMDVAEYAIPWHWQSTIILHGFEPVIHTDIEFVKFCKHMIFTK